MRLEKARRDAVEISGASGEEFGDNRQKLETCSVRYAGIFLGRFLGGRAREGGGERRPRPPALLRRPPRAGKGRRALLRKLTAEAGVGYNGGNKPAPLSWGRLNTHLGKELCVMEPRGRMMLKVTGILYIVFAVLSMVGGLVAMLGGGLFALGGIGANAYLGAAMGGVVLFSGLVLILSNILGLVTGILGVRYCDKPEKAQVCFVLGVILIVFAALSLLGDLFGSASASDIFSGLVGLALPICYTVGASWNKQSAQPPML